MYARKGSEFTLAAFCFFSVTASQPSPSSRPDPGSQPPRPLPRNRSAAAPCPAPSTHRRRSSTQQIPRPAILLKSIPAPSPAPKRIQMNRQPSRQRPHRNHIPDPLSHNRHRNKIHLRRLVRYLMMAGPPRRPHRKPPMMPRRRRLHLHPPQPTPPRVHDQVILLVVPIRLRHHQSPARHRHHKLHLRQVPPILAVPSSARFPASRFPFSHEFVPF
jgi:hypothetical protein